MSDHWNPTVDRFDEEAEWLAARRRKDKIGTVITASDSPAILGVGYANTGPHTVYAEKTSDEPSEEDVDEATKEMFEVGHIMEPAIRSVFELKKNIKLKRDTKYAIRYSRDYPWLGATLDAYYYHVGRRLIPVEFKSIDVYNAREWEDGPPLKVLVQVQHQIAVCNAPFGWAMAFGGPSRVFVKRIPRDQKFIEALIFKLMEFRSHCETRNPPPPDFTVACERALVKLHPDDNGLAITLPEEALEVAAELEQVKEYLKDAENKERHLKNVLKGLIGDYSYGRLPDGRGFSWKTIEKKPYMVHPKKYRDFRLVKSIPKAIEVVDREKLQEAQAHGRKAIESGGSGQQDDRVHPDGGVGGGETVDLRD